MVDLVSSADDRFSNDRFSNDMAQNDKVYHNTQ